ncbi:unknown [Parabacteroides merdae CAG:48]|nr:unknown [Parabacteroides merdae CAG:48]
MFNFKFANTSSNSRTEFICAIQFSRERKLFLSSFVRQCVDRVITRHIDTNQIGFPQSRVHIRLSNTFTTKCHRVCQRSLIPSQVSRTGLQMHILVTDLCIRDSSNCCERSNESRKSLVHNLNFNINNTVN